MKKKKVIKKKPQSKNTAISSNAAYFLAGGHHNIVFGANQQTLPNDSYMLALGDFRYQMTPEEFNQADKGVREAIYAIRWDMAKKIINDALNHLA